MLTRRLALPFALPLLLGSLACQAAPGPGRPAAPAEPMIGVHGNTIHALPHGELREVLRRFGRLEER